jgi:hypothetical protein
VVAGYQRNEEIRYSNLKLEASQMLSNKKDKVGLQETISDLSEWKRSF